MPLVMAGFGTASRAVWLVELRGVVWPLATVEGGVPVVLVQVPGRVDCPQLVSGGSPEHGSGLGIANLDKTKSDGIRA